MQLGSHDELAMGPAALRHVLLDIVVVILVRQALALGALLDFREKPTKARASVVFSSTFRISSIRIMGLVALTCRNA